MGAGVGVGGQVPPQCLGAHMVVNVDRPTTYYGLTMSNSLNDTLLIY